MAWIAKIHTPLHFFTPSMNQEPLNVAQSLVKIIDCSFNLIILDRHKLIMPDT